MLANRSPLLWIESILSREITGGTLPDTRQVVVSSLVGGNAIQLASNTENITYWFAKGVGYVKSVATGGNNNETVVLTEYKK